MRNLSKIPKYVLYFSVLICIVIVFHYFVFASNATETKEELVIVDNVVLTSDEKETLDIINETRKSYGLATLQIREDLQRVAKLKAEDIINNKYLSHTSPTYGTPHEMLEKNNIKFKMAGENLAVNQENEKAVKEWMNSSAHRSNILDPNYKFTGLCVLNSYEYGKIYVQLFLD